MPIRFHRFFIAVVLLYTLTGCKPDAAVKKAEVIGRGSRPAGEPPTLQQAPATPAVAAQGIIAGTVFFKGTPPAKKLIDTSMDPACGFSGSGPLYTEQFVVSDGKAGGKLANVFVYVKSGPPAAMQSGVVAPPVVLDQKGCRYVPHVIGVTQGGYVEFRNADPTMHNIHTMPTTVGNDTIDLSQGPRGNPVSRQFRTPELMIPVRCNNHPWMQAFINVAPTPFFAVTDGFGHFELRNLPPGDYTLGAVHEKLGEKTLQLTVPPDSPAKADFSFAQ